MRSTSTVSGSESGTCRVPGLCQWPFNLKMAPEFPVLRLTGIRPSMVAASDLALNRFIPGWPRRPAGGATGSHAARARHGTASMAP
jgi:hypothetical protein